MHDVSKLRPAWSTPFEAFVGPHLVSEAFRVDGHGDNEFVFESEPDPEVLWRSADGYAIHPIQDFDPATVVLVKDSETVGYYMGGELWIDPPHRGRGLAPEMVLACLAWHGALPYDTGIGLGFSAAGLQAHLSAHARAVGLAVAAGLPVPDEVAEEYAGSAPRP